MQRQPTGTYWDDRLGRLVHADEPEWDSATFAAAVASNEIDRDTIPVPPPGEDDVVLEGA
jgi:hypothetical protein